MRQKRRGKLAKYDNRGYITELEPNEVIVFGSNTAGIHGAGAALQAYREFGAKYGCGEGLCGQSWAFPTLDKGLRKVHMHELVASRDRLYAAAEEYSHLTFLLTKVGCGLAGFPEEEMRALFSRQEEHPVGVIMPYKQRPANIILPEDWRSK